MFTQSLVHVRSSLLAARFPWLMTLPIIKPGSLPFGDGAGHGLELMVQQAGTPDHSPGLESAEGQILACFMALSPHRGPK